jgi:cytochrome b involved in lipid metabolism
LITLQEVQTHNKPDVDCWVVYYGQVYDLTSYQHPKIGNSVIFCGTESTSQFSAVHPQTYLDMVQDRVVGYFYTEQEGEDDDSSTDNTVATVSHTQLQAHNTSEDCWTIYHGKVYDMTEFALNHPVAGPDVIWEFCGGDGTNAYSIYHPESLLAIVQGYYIGPFCCAFGDSTGSIDSDNDKEPTTTPVTRAISLSEVRIHNGTSDCWTVMYGDVYDLTWYRHPGDRTQGYGQRVIYQYSCGKDSTRDYASVHPRDLLKKTNMNRFKIGWVTSSARTVSTGWMVLCLSISMTALALLW